MMTPFMRQQLRALTGGIEPTFDDIDSGADDTSEMPALPQAREVAPPPGMGPDVASPAIDRTVLHQAYKLAGLDPEGLTVQALPGYRENPRGIAGYLGEPALTSALTKLNIPPSTARSVEDLAGISGERSLARARAAYEQMLRESRRQTAEDSGRSRRGLDPLTIGAGMAAANRPGASLVQTLGAGLLNAQQQMRADRREDQAAEREARQQAAGVLSYATALDKADAPKLVTTRGGGIYRVPQQGGGVETLVKPEPQREPAGSEAIQIARLLEDPDLPPRRRELLEQRWRRLVEKSGVTSTQEARNSDVLYARETLAELGMTPEKILAATQSKLSTGRDNPDYNPGIARMVRLAQRKLVGVDDPGHAETWRMIYGKTPPGEGGPEPGPVDTSPGFLTRGLGAGVAQPDEPSAQPQPGLVDRARNWVNRQFESGPSPQKNGSMSRGGVFDQIPRKADGGIDASKLTRGRSYELPDGSRVQWDGSNFVTQ